jgi:hypothetical protein
LINYNLLCYLEQFRVNDYKGRGVYSVDNGLFIEREGLGPIARKFGKMIICFETGTVFVTKSKQTKLTRRAALFFPDMNHNFYVIERALKLSLDKYHCYINLPIEKSGKINAHKLLPVHTCIEYYSKFGNNEPPITLDTSIESLLTNFLNNADNIALIININEVTSLIFKTSKNPGYLDSKLDYQINMNFTPKAVLLSVTIEKEKQDLQKQIDNYNLLISNNISFIKDKQKELVKNRKEVKQLKCKLD